MTYEQMSSNSSSSSSGTSTDTHASSLHCLLTQVLWLLLVLSALQLCQRMPYGAEAVPLFTNPGMNIEFRRYCSNQLSNTIDMVCGGQTNTLGRRFPNSVGTGSTRALRRFAPNTDGVFYRPTHSGPIHECCRRPCGYSELKMYCAE